MDPNEALRQIRRITKTGQERELTDLESSLLVDLIDGLDTRLDRSGFLPEAWTSAKVRIAPVAPVEISPTLMWARNAADWIHAITCSSSAVPLSDCKRTECVAANALLWPQVPRVHERVFTGPGYLEATGYIEGS